MVGVSTSKVKFSQKLTLKERTQRIEAEIEKLEHDYTVQRKQLQEVVARIQDKVKMGQRRREIAETQRRAQVEAVQKPFSLRPVQAPAMIEQSSGEPDSKPTVSGDALTFLGTGTHATPVLSELVSGISEGVTFEAKIPAGAELLKNEVPFQEIKIKKRRYLLKERTLKMKKQIHYVWDHRLIPSLLQ